MLGRHLLTSVKTVPSGTVWEFTSDTFFEIPASGIYKIIIVGAGGRGGNGSSANTCIGTRLGSTTNKSVSGSGGGGGGSGQTVIETHRLKFKAALNIVVGAHNGAATKITGALTITANGGAAGSGGNVNPNYPGRSYPECGAPGPYSGSGGAGGAGYNPGGRGSDSASCGGPSSGGSGGISDYGGNVGKGGNGGIGKGSGCSGNTSGPGAGENGYPGICRIEFLGR